MAFPLSDATGFNAAASLVRPTIDPLFRGAAWLHPRKNHPAEKETGRPIRKGGGRLRVLQVSWKAWKPSEKAVKPS